MTDIKQENPQMPEDEAQILASTAQDHMDRIALRTFEVVAVQKTIAFQVPDDRFNGIASFQLAPDACRHAALLASLVNRGIGNIVTAITQINVAAFGLLSR